MKRLIFVAFLGLLLATACNRDNTELYNQAVEFEENQEYAKAVEKLTEALAIDSKDIECLNNRAWDYYDLDQKDKALEDFKRMLEVDPQSTAAMYGIAYLSYEQEQYEEALNYFNSIIEIQGSLDNAVNRSNRKHIINAPLDLVFDMKAFAEEALGIVHEMDTLDISPVDTLEVADVTE